MERRAFIKSTLAAAGALSLQNFPYHLFAGEVKKFANDRIKLGNTGLEVSRLAMGTGTHGVNRKSNQTRKLGIQGVADWLEAAYDENVIFWDSADQYGTHPHLKEALKRVPREKVVILTKTHATSEEEMKADLDRFRQEIGTDYLDIVLLHFQQDPNWPTIKEGAMNILSRAREDGIVGAHGVSCHTLGALQAAADSDWVQVDLARINPAGVAMDAEVSKVVPVLKKMKEQGKVVIGMKILGAGRLADRIDECLQFALAQEYVDCFTIGTESQAEFRDLVKRIPAASVRG
jgi:aryl-alcohol dehydrogenase-like predicted oxidoreductase